MRASTYNMCMTSLGARHDQPGCTTWQARVHNTTSLDAQHDKPGWTSLDARHNKPGCKAQCSLIPRLFKVISWKFNAIHCTSPVKFRIGNKQPPECHINLRACKRPLHYQGCILLEAQSELQTKSCQIQCTLHVYRYANIILAWV